MQRALNEAERHDRAYEAGRKSLETGSGPHERSKPLADYYPLIFLAVSRLEPNTAETRRSIYGRARTAMLLQLRSMTPSFAESEISREQSALEEAIKQVETESLHHLGTPTWLSMQAPHRAFRRVKDISDICPVTNDGNSRSAAAVKDEDHAGCDAAFASKLALSKPDLSVELEHLQDKIRRDSPSSSIARKLVPIAIVALLVFAAGAPGAY